MRSSPPRPSLSDKGLPLNVPEFRRLLPAPVPGLEGTSSGSNRGPSLPSRLHPRTNHTKIACEPCRKRKGKCFGERPKCSDCINRDLDCYYQASDRDPRVLERLYGEAQEKNTMYEQFCHLLRCLSERESNAILRRLRDDVDVARIMQQVTDGDLLVQAKPITSNSQVKVTESVKDRRGPLQSPILSYTKSMLSDHMPDGLPRFHGLDQVLFTSDNPEAKPPTEAWTTITNDINLVLHLLALYFCWEYPTFASLSKEHFLRDFRDGRHRYCSPLLVNALLALGCRFSTHPMTRANSEDSHSAGDHFFKESQRLFDQETDHHSLTTIQALGIMSIREASCGRDSESRYYVGQSIQLAFEMGLHHAHDEGDQDELSVKLATFWGAFSLDHVYSLVTGSLPQCSRFSHLPSKPLIIKDIEAKLWVPYTDDGVTLQLPCEQQSNERSVYKCFCELSELVHQSLYLIHTPGKSLTARGLLNTFTEYLSWYDAMPDVLRLGHNFSPAVLFAHMYYHFAILLLFRPFIKLRIIGSQVSPRDVCLEAANAIQDLLMSYSRLYSLKRAPSFMPYFALASSIMHLTIMAAAVHREELDTTERTDSHVSETFKQGIANLAEMTPCHHIAAQAPHILCYLAKKWNVSVDVDTGAALNLEEYEKVIRQSAGSLNSFLLIMIVEDSICHWNMEQEVEMAESVESVESPLFWPFLMQRRPMLLTGKELEQADFVVL